MRLFELTKAYTELETLADNPETSDEQICVFLDECKGALEEKVKNIVKFIENLEATAEAIHVAEQRMFERRKSIENRVESIKSYVLNNMKASNIHKIECEFFEILRQKNPHKVVIDDEKSINIQYFRQPEIPPPEIDKKLILDHIKNGILVDGAHMEQDERLSIK